MKRIQIVGLFLLAVLPVVPGCMLVTCCPEHKDWTRELSVLGADREVLPLRISCLPASYPMVENPTSYEHVRIVRDVLKDGPFSISEGLSFRDDMAARISVNRSARGSPSLVPSLLTAYIIPSCTTTTVILKIEFTDREDRVFKHYKREARTEQWWGWAFFLWGTFASDHGASITLLKDMARDIVKEIYEKDYDDFKTYASPGRR